MGKKIIPTKRKHHEKTLGIAFVIFGAFMLLVIGAGLLITQGTDSFCANSISCIKNLTGQKEASNEGTFMGQKVTAPDIPEKPLYALKEAHDVLADSAGDYKHIYVSLDKQRLYAYEGTRLVYDFPVSTGKGAWNATPTGDFRIWVWLRYTRMSGGNQAAGTYYNLPNVPYTMFYYNSTTPKSWGYSIHGAYWHNNFGHPMSHGCTNMKPEDAAKIFYWTNPNAGNVSYPTAENPGTLITVYGTTPNE